ncbi:beta-ketoacyl-[acyl-carrier-protein] synthase family protein [Moheibacter lacus]|uniref:Beta-ketoacyl-[acyl-carrier-protein] synthase family protein n=1 Tax=Moheibacter lacus TaxID=2745851 RepID=A0A838ZR62_9FLAO|nr:beta-ketoacyl-[acyl-carrier-protein] synthase family protein [Moheibacter lacus]MBA5628782.1 beta-ketoacyl-[acyl-carrier-protein] synthase family protein [Moheibacter lacus]
MKQKPIAITGMGIISAIGNNVAENENSLLRNQHGIKKYSVPDPLIHQEKLVGEILKSNEEFYSELNLNSDEAFTRSTLLGLTAAKEAIISAKLNLNNGLKTGFISATTVGGMDATEKFYFDFLKSDENKKFIPAQNCGIHAEQIAKTLGIKDYITTISTACSSAANAIMLGARMIKAGILDRAVVGGTDSLSAFTINGFSSLMIYSDEHCLPFDDNRKGLNLGEAAAYIVLESEESAKGKEILGFLSGYGNANDAFHQTASSDDGEGAFLAMKTALEIAGLKAEEIDYVNAHGTATPNNDLSEGKSLERIFKNVPDFSSTKAFTGHTLAAAGAVEAVFSLLAIKNQCVFANLNWKNPMKEFGLKPETEIKKKEIKTVLSNSLGFGGNCSSLIFEKN